MSQLEQDCLQVALDHLAKGLVQMNRLVSRVESGGVTSAELVTGLAKLAIGHATSAGHYVEAAMDERDGQRLSVRGARLAEAEGLASRTDGARMAVVGESAGITRIGWRVPDAGSGPLGGGPRPTGGSQHTRERDE